MRVVVIDANFSSLAQEEAAAREGGASFHFANTNDPLKIAEAVDGASVVLVQFAQLQRPALQRLAPGARVIRYGVGYDNIDVKSARELGIKVAYVPDYCTDEVADHAAAMTLCLSRKILFADRHVRLGQWSAIEACAPLPPFSESVVGFLGYGRIARAVHQRLQPFHFSFLYHDPAVATSDQAGGSAMSVRLDELLSRSDILSLHLPSTPETRHIIDAGSLRRMKPGSHIVNVARGDLIDVMALAQALKEKHIGGAALDVFEEEPLPFDHPIRDLSDVILSPHAAWYSDGSLVRLQQLAADEISRALAGQDVRQPVPA